MYTYEKQKQVIFTEEGQKMFLKIRDHAQKLFASAGAARMQEIMSGAGGGDSWDMLACVDRLVELGEIREVTSGQMTTQFRVFVSAR